MVPFKSLPGREDENDISGREICRSRSALAKIPASAFGAAEAAMQSEALA